MNKFEIMFNDLTPDAQKRLLEFYKIESEEVFNWETNPIAVFETPDCDNCDDCGLCLEV